VHRNPSQALWRDGVKFAFKDAAGNVVDTSSQVVDSTAARMATMMCRICSKSCR
jgi:hypothetical protein